MSALTLDGPNLQHVTTFATSLALGFLIGLERERKSGARAGVRTFALTAVFGTLAAMLSAMIGSPWILPVSLLAVTFFIVAAYFGDKSAESGTTTQIALLVCFSLGVMLWYGERTLAIMLAIVTTALLYFKPELEGISKSLTRRDLVSILQFAVVTFIVLPVLPNQNFGPYSALNPYQVWLMVVLISGVSLAGYIALRIFGERNGGLLLGLLGGLVSSTATTLVYTKHARANPDMRRLGISVILLANLVVLPRLAVLVGILAPEILPRLLPVLGSGLLFGLGFTLLQLRRQHQEKLPMPDITNPAELRTAVGFGLLYAGVLLASAWLSHIAGDKGLYAVSLASGLVDVDAIALSSMRLFNLGQLTTQPVVIAIILALLANLSFKWSLVLTIGGRSLAVACLPAMAAVAVGCVAALLIF